MNHPAGDLPGGVPRGHNFQKRVYRGAAAPRACTSMLQGGGIDVQCAAPENLVELRRLDKLEYLNQTQEDRMKGSVVATKPSNIALATGGVYQVGEGWAREGVYSPNKWMSETKEALAMREVQTVQAAPAAGFSSTKASLRYTNS